MIDFILKKFYMFSDFSIDKNENYYIIHRNNIDYYLYHFLSSDLIIKAYQLSLNTYNNFSYIYNIFHNYITYYNHDYYVLISIKHNIFFHQPEINHNQNKLLSGCGKPVSCLSFHK